MPRFGEQEKARIRQCLMNEGERLFRCYGLKKVTIDEIAKSVNIAKATFYRFYEGKEHLFLDIAQKQQSEVFEILTNVLVQSSDKSDKERVRMIFWRMSELMESYPLLAGIDKETAETIARRVSVERLESYSRQGFDAVKTIEEHGISFRYDTQVISGLFHTIYQSWLNLCEQPVKAKEQIINIMLDGVLGQILH